MNYVPYISREVLDACYQTMIEEGYDEDLISSLLRDNPSIFNMIQDVTTSGHFNEDFVEGFVKGCTMIFRLINSQMECNAMNENIKL